MIAAVCCPGPSLPATWRNRAGYDVVIVVNRALLHIPDADWLSAADIVLFQGLLGDHRPRVGVLTGPDTATCIRGDDSWGEIRTWPLSPTCAEHTAIRSLQWSVQAALCLAADLGADAIDLHGTIGNGQREDCTGYAGENRTPERWEREAADLSVTISLLLGRGITTRRIYP